MKFLNYNNILLWEFYEYEHLFKDNFSENYYDYDFVKDFIKKRKYINKSRPGAAKKIKNNSLNRSFNKNLIVQYVNISQKNGLYNSLFKKVNLAVENLFLILSTESPDFYKFKNYMNLFYMFLKDSDYSNINFLIDDSINNLESIFEIKAFKNSKKSKSNLKYRFEIVYIPPKKRFKYILRSLSFYKENFKNYFLWERIFWSFFQTILNKDNSFLKKRRNYIYFKSVKFFKRKK